MYFEYLGSCKKKLQKLQKLALIMTFSHNIVNFMLLFLKPNLLTLNDVFQIVNL